MRRDDVFGKPIYPIRIVREMTGFTDRQIRYYEKIGFISPARSKGNQRLYSEREVERLRKLRAFVDQGIELSTARELAKETESREIMCKTTCPRFVEMEKEKESDAISHFRGHWVTQHNPEGAFGIPASFYTLANAMKFISKGDPR